MKKLLAIGAITLTLVGGVMSPAFAAHTPETRAGVISAVLRDPANECADTENSKTSISHGVAEISIHSLEGNSCSNGGPGCNAVWAYTGTDWGILGSCTQESSIYPTTLPGKLIICKGASHTVIRSGPGSTYSVVGSVTKNVSVSTDQLQLQTKGYASRDGLSDKDGLGWYRIVWHGKRAWVASYRVASPSEGCGFWAQYWSYMHHR